MQIHQLLSFMQELIGAKVTIGFGEGLLSVNALKGPTEQYWYYHGDWRFDSPYWPNSYMVELLDHYTLVLFGGVYQHICIG